MCALKRKDCLDHWRFPGFRTFQPQGGMTAVRLLKRLAAGWLLAAGLLSGGVLQDAAATTVVYFTGFEAGEGYSTSADLAGQNGWVQFGTGGNGVVSNFFEGYGQQAYIGYAAPVNADDTLNVWRPINLSPVPANTPLVRFSVWMAVVDSSNGQQDDFRWSVYNTEGYRLFSLDFDGVTLDVSYVLDDGAGFVGTGRKFAKGTLYELVIFMNLTSNEWSATLAGEVLATAKPITTAGSALNLGDVDAVWSIRTPGSAGDNYLLFDEYRITTGPVVQEPPVLQTVARLAEGGFRLRVFGDPGVTCVVDASSDLQSWIPLETNTVPNDGVFEFQDNHASGLVKRFYRARQWP